MYLPRGNGSRLVYLQAGHSGLSPSIVAPASASLLILNMAPPSPEEGGGERIRGDGYCGKRLMNEERIGNQ